MEKIAEKNEIECDVVVVGAGFGGAAAAKKCADAGLKTIMIERSEKVGEKIISGLTIPFHGFLFGPDFIRDGNPPIERPVDGIINYIIKDIEKNDIDIDDSLRVPKPFSPIFSVGYNAFCKAFCEWEVQQAVESGVELRTKTTVVDVIRDNGHIRGVITEKNEQIWSKIIINAEGSHGLLAIKAGVRKKYPPDVISLADVYVYDMDKKDIDRIFGFSLKFCWGWDEQKIAPPLGHGNGLMVWPYSDSLHLMQDQCLRNDDGPVYNLVSSLKGYHEKITTNLPWWRDEIAPKARLRARMWDGFEIFVGLDERLRNMPNFTDGMLLIGDAAGLENTELCDGVPTAWFSAEIAADVAIEAISHHDTSASFLKRYDDRIKAHPIIQWAITSTNRYNLRYAQKEHDEKKLKKYIHDGWGLGFCKHGSTALMKITLSFIKKDPQVIGKWIRMYLRYYYHWHHLHYENTHASEGTQNKQKGIRLKTYLRLMDWLLRIFSPLIRFLAGLLEPLSGAANPVMKLIFPIIAPMYLRLIKKWDAAFDPLSKRWVKAVVTSDPSIFDV
jgi:electron transfer flavoprotein-quinone oxidoreductase